MELKFYLNKFLKVDNIEDYTLYALKELRKCYDNFLENSGGVDPDFPLINFGDKGKKVQGVNKVQAEDNENGDEMKTETLTFSKQNNAYT